jgi:hypothetical protein
VSASCPVCLEPFAEDADYEVFCVACDKEVHETCLSQVKRRVHDARLAICLACARNDPAYRPNPEPHPVATSRAVRKYEEFHARDADTQHAIPANIPKTVYLVGYATNVEYRSPKWTGKNVNYTHEHDDGVKFYRVDKTPEGRPTKVPQWILNTKVWVWLGKNMGFRYEDFDGEGVEGAVGKTKPELLCTPNGKALMIVEGNRVKCLIWGGKLNVKDVGIVN